MRYLAIDLGSTFIKGAVLDLDARSFAHVRRVPFPAPILGLPPLHYEVDPRQIIEATRALLDDLARDAPDCAGLVLCGQQHGLVLIDARGGPASNAITWRDQRALGPHPAGGTLFEHLKRRVSPEDRQRLGNELRPGLPLCALVTMAELVQLPPSATAAALPDFVLAQLCGAPPATDATMAAAQGALDLAARDWHRPLLEALGLGGLAWPTIQDIRTPVGEARVGARRVPCYPAIGDQQCALLGAALQPGELSLNISTGSQVSLIRPALAFGDYQVRPFFDGAWLNTITHIPAGRALELLVTLLCELAETQGVRVPDPWGAIARAVEATPATDLTIDLAFFASALGDRGAIGNIHEGNLSAGHVFRAAFERMAATYALCAHRLSPEAEWSRLVFSGGLAQNLPALRESVVGQFGAPYRVCATTEDTLQGLLALALVCSGRAATLAEAVAAVGGDAAPEPPPKSECSRDIGIKRDDACNSRISNTSKETNT
ncbi:MAG TPA: FGGY family carbohydrate kinase [Roseiflexaceae bacterium]|nr:FGGY family carbohydrate kinase [Roseiflexaceae bacterium]